MYLYVDGNTQKDLSIFASSNTQYAVSAFFNHTQTVLGGVKLNSMLKTPLSDLQMIEERRDSIAFFQRTGLYFAINREDIDFVEYYLEQTGEPRKFSRYNAVIKFIDNKIKPNSAYYVVERGVEYLIYLLNAFHDFVLELQALECPVYVRKQNQQLLALFDRDEYKSLKNLDASVEVVKALSGNRNCFYFISSHLIEIADEVKGKDNIIFASFDVEASEDKIPTYTYKLKEGISANRVGMHILRREKVIETIMDSYS